MKGFKIFMHALCMVFGNLGAVVRIFVIPFALLTAIVFVAAVEVGEELGSKTDLFSTSNALWLLLFAAAAIFINIWVAVSWHRFVLLEEQPQGLFPKIHAKEMKSYFFKLLILIVIFAVALIFLLMVLTFVMGALMGTISSFGVAGAVIATVLLPLLLTIVVGVPVIRACVALPAAALGSPLTISEAFAETESANWPIAVLLTIQVLLNTLFVLVLGWLVPEPFWLGQLASYSLNVFLWTFNISVLTTLYGHYVEKRALT